VDQLSSVFVTSPGLWVQPVVMPFGDPQSWTLVDQDAAVVEPVEAFLSHLHAIERSPNTVKARQRRLVTGGCACLFLTQLKEMTQTRVVGTQRVQLTRETLDTANGQLLCAAHSSAEGSTLASAPRALSPLWTPS
jgi:hypothetical protein